jgi:hypothetical protein
MRDLTPGFALFVGGFVAALFFLAAGLVYVAGAGLPVVGGFAVVLVALGGLAAAVGVGSALLLKSAE